MQHQPAGQRRPYRVDAGEGAEHRRRHSAQREQVGAVGQDRGHQAAGDGQPDSGHRRRVTGEPGQADRRPDGGRDQAGGGGALQAGQPAAERAVQQDVGGPGGGGQQGQGDAEDVGGGAGVGEHHHPGAGQDGAGQVARAPGAGDGHGERSDELEGDRQGQTDPLDRGVQADVHHAEDDRQPEHGPPLVPPKGLQRRTRRRRQGQRGEDLPDRDHADRADRAERQRSQRGSRLVRRRTAEHERDAGSAPSCVVHGSTVCVSGI